MRKDTTTTHDTTRTPQADDHGRSRSMDRRTNERGVGVDRINESLIYYPPLTPNTPDIDQLITQILTNPIMLKVTRH